MSAAIVQSRAHLLLTPNTPQNLAVTNLYKLYLGGCPSIGVRSGIIMGMSHIVAAGIGGTHIRVVLNEPSTKPIIAHQRRQRRDQPLVPANGLTRYGKGTWAYMRMRIVGKQDINSLPSARDALWAATKWWTADRLTTG